MIKGIGKVRVALEKRGGRSFGMLRRQFKIMDDNGNNKLDRNELKYGLRDFNCELSRDDIEGIFKKYDSDGSGQIDVNEFLRAIRGEMNEKRKAVVKKAFMKLDDDASGTIDLAEIKKRYTAKSEESMKRFFDKFQPSDKEKDEKIELEEFYEYYARVGANLDRDDQFVDMVERSWGLSE